MKMLTGKGVIQAGEGTIIAVEGVIATCQVQGAIRAGQNF